MGTLYVVATPIGNLEDVTLRALAVLREAHLVLAEDTRHTRVLLGRHGIAAKPRSLHAHNEAARSEEVLTLLAGGASVALVSDAGTPLVSDPGERLVASALAAGHAVVPIPGASALLAALVASGIASSPFCFLGFLPRKASLRAALLASYRARPETLVLFESPQRVGATLRDLAAALGPRAAAVARELTKLHEEVARGTLAELALRFADGARGEITLVVAGAAPEPVSAEALRARVAELVAEGLGARDVATRVAAETGASRRELYQLALAEAKQR